METTITVLEVNPLSQLPSMKLTKKATEKNSHSLMQLTGLNHNCQQLCSNSGDGQVLKPFDSLSLSEASVGGLHCSMLTFSRTLINHSIAAAYKSLFKAFPFKMTSCHCEHHQCSVPLFNYSVIHVRICIQHNNNNNCDGVRPGVEKIYRDEKN